MPARSPHLAVGRRRKIARQRRLRRAPCICAASCAKVDPEPIVLPGHKGWVFGLAFHPDNKRLASAGRDGVVRISDIDAGKEVATFAERKGRVASVAFSPDGRSLASGGEDHLIEIRDLATSVVERTIAGHKGWVYSLAFSPDGKRLASSSFDHFIRISDLADAAGVPTILEGHTDQVRGIGRFGPDGGNSRRPASIKRFDLWDPETGWDVFAA